MGERNTTIRSSYFEHRDITLGSDEIVVVACLHNEAVRLPYFLDYYRGLGVTRFLLADNDSTDGGREYLHNTPIELPANTRNARFRAGKGWAALGSGEPELSAT